FRPNDDFKVRLIADYDKIDEICCTVANLVDGPTGAAVRALGGRINSNRPFSYDSFNNFESVNDIKNYGVSGQADWNVSDTLALTSISAYRAVRSYTNQDSDFTSADLIGRNDADTNINTYTQELRLASDFDGFFNFLLGGFYFKEDISSDSVLTFGRDFRGYANALTGGAYASLEPTLRLLSGLPAATAATAFGAQGQGRFESYDFKNEAVSLFGQGDFKLSEDLTFTAGFNYTKDKKSARSDNRSTDVFSAIDLVQVGAAAGIPGSIPLPTGTIFPRTTACPATGAIPGTCNPFLALRPLQFLPPFLNFPNAVESGKTNDDDLSYTLRLSWEANENLSTYATYATGFKASSFNLSTDSRPFPTDFIPGSVAQVPAPAASPIRTAGLALPNLTTGTRFAAPEEATVYEVGMKGQYEGFGFNLAIFKQVLKNFQGNVFQGTGFVLSNAEKQSTRGFELDTSFKPMPSLDLTASVTYLDPKFDSYTGGSSFNATNNVVPTNLTGQRPTGISKWTTVVGATYTHDLDGSNELVLHADYLTASSFTVAQGLPYKASPESLNASIAFKMENGFEFMIWGRNLTEPKFNPTIFPSVAQSGSLSGYPSGPKTYGGSIRYRF
ncbi:MAG: TonB-dependent receptor, partial [Alphaproteobacteria bacterium]|nr:TonB-dependent receptor [Alphaproteobacteria bacterium]